ncbi:hypothetical protein DFH07DRAFT_940130 [Mycena maculata]|uniref:Uncharacterized protein n=1 Tax=Mycena maculata TaxID=230809 RepID=A0AAD7JA29_9AGAR|nr:hypothetical protein DFH07DRAFT_940130 [Mycena maculata]
MIVKSYLILFLTNSTTYTLFKRSNTRFHTPFTRMEDTCLGMGPDGITRCICRRSVLKANQDPDDPDICKNCNHMSSSHPREPAARLDINSFVNNLRTAGKANAAPSLSSQLKSSLSDAEIETTAGLRGKKRKIPATKTDSEPESSNNNNKRSKSELKAMKEKMGKQVQIQKLVFLPDGLNGSNGRLNRQKLTSTYFDLLLHYGLAKLSTPSNPLVIFPGWSNAQLCDWIEGHFPKAIEYLLAHPYSADAHESETIRGQLWRVCIKSGHELTLSYELLPTRANVANICAPVGRTIQQRVLIITSKLRISSEKYADWDAESDHEPSDYVLSEEDEDLLETLGPKGKGKGKALVKPERRTDLVPASSSGRSTRLSTGTIQWNKDVLIHDVLDSEEEELPESLAPAAASSNSSDTAPSSSNAVIAGSSNAAVSVSSNTVVAPQDPLASSSIYSPLFSSFATPSPPQAHEAPAFFTHWPPAVSLNNSGWTAAVTAAAAESGATGGTSSSMTSTSQGGFPTSVRNTRPNPW